MIVTDVDEADALVTLRTYYRNREQTVMDAEHRGMPIYVLRANTVAQVEQFLGDLYNISEQQHPRDSMDSVQERIDDYLAFGVPHVWVINPRKPRAFHLTADAIQDAKDGVLRTTNPEIVVPIFELENPVI